MNSLKLPAPVRLPTRGEPKESSCDGVALMGIGAGIVASLCVSDPDIWSGED